MNLRSQIRSVLAVTALSLVTLAPLSSAEASPDSQALIQAADAAVHHRFLEVDGVDVFYREAGPRDAPTVVLLHGFPSSSHMFRHLIPALATRYHVIAPDYPGFGHSEAPDRSEFRYTFAHLAEVTDTLLQRLQVKRYALYVMDYGAPVGYRLAIEHPGAREGARGSERKRLRGGAAGVLESRSRPTGRAAHRRTARRFGARQRASPRALSTPTASRTSRASIRARGCTIRRCWIDPATWRFSSICSTTTERTSTSIRASTSSSANSGRRR